MPMPSARSTISSSTVMPSTGVAITWMIAVPYSPHRNSGMRNQVIPFGRSLWIVTMKFSPVKIDEKPRMNTPNVIAITEPLVGRAVRACRTSTRCRRRRW